MNPFGDKSVDPSSSQTDSHGATLIDPVETSTTPEDSLHPPVDLLVESSIPPEETLDNTSLVALDLLVHHAMDLPREESSLPDKSSG